MDDCLRYESNVVGSSLCVIHFDPYDDIRDIGVKFEKNFREVKENNVIVLPVPESEPPEVTRFVSVSLGYSCEFGQDRVSCKHQEIPEPKSSLEQSLGDFQRLVTETYRKLFQLTNSKIVQAGMVVDVFIPTIEPEAAAKLIQEKFFKFSGQSPNQFRVDFHYSQQQEEAYNINVIVKPAGRIGGLPENSLVLVKIDINNYLAAANNPNQRYDEDVLTDISSRISNYFGKDIETLFETGGFVNG